MPHETRRRAEQRRASGRRGRAMKPYARALLHAGLVALLPACTAPGGGRGPDPALGSNAAVTPGGSELGTSGSSNDLRPGERTPMARPLSAPRGVAVDVVPPRGP